MSEFIPVNHHVWIEPLTQEGFVVEQQQHFEEKGRVLRFAPDINLSDRKFKEGDIVYFDSWLAAKLATGEMDEQSQPKYRWVVKYEDIRGYEPLSTI